MTNKTNIAIIGATSLKGEVLIAKLSEATLDIDEVFLLADEATAGEEVAFGRKEIMVTLASDFDFTKVQHVISVADSAFMEQLYPALEDAGCSVIDASGFLGQRQDASLATLLDDHSVAKVVAIPEATTLQLWFALQPLLQETSIAHMHVTVMQCAAHGGQAALEELGQQTSQLLNFREVKPSVFEKQLAFNMIPQIGELAENKESVTEILVAEQLSRLCVMPRTDIDVTMIWSPVFFGDVASVSLQFQDAIAMEYIISQWQENPMLAYSPDQIHTPVNNASGKSVINLSRVRSWQMANDNTQISFCLMTDPIQLSATICALMLKNQLGD